MEKLNLTPTINLQRADKNGKHAIRIRSTVKRKVTYYPTKISVFEYQFVNKEVVKHPNKVLLNASIRKKMAEIEKGVLEGALRISHKEIDFLKFCEAKIKQQKVRDSIGTWKHKNSYLNKFKEFRSSLNFKEITPGLMMEYESFCKKKGNAHNTIWSSVKFVREMVNEVLKDEKPGSNPLENYKPPQYINPVRNYLVDTEIDKIERLASESKSDKLVKVANWFLFSCYCGLRYEDVRTFDKSSIIDGRLILRTGKSKTDVSIKIHPRLKNILERISYEVMSNQKINDYLKIIAERCEIEKNLTYHVARHTFAVYFLDHGGSIETLSKLLGHKKLTTTQIYGKITNVRIDKEVEAVWG